MTGEFVENLARTQPGEPATDGVIDRVADRFEADWEIALQGGALPNVTDYLAEVAEPLRAAVRQELEAIDRECRQRLQHREALKGKVGKYEVVRALGQGGQASAYLAYDPDLKRHVVLKLYWAAGSAAEQEAILREGQALARVRHPFVAQCHGVERHVEVPCLVVEFVPGPNLAQRQRTRPLTVPEALDLIACVAEGLAAVHACGLLHLDLKPGNVIVADDGRPRLVDFGLARPLGDEALRHISGTLAYMAPEQARGEVSRIDPRTDVFGLGAVLYELLTGAPPYRADNRAALLELARAGDIVPARQLNPRLPRAVSDLCMRCLAKDPTNRPGSATELAQAIRCWQRRSRRKPWVAAIAAALLLAATGLISCISRPPGEAPRGTGPAAGRGPRAEVQFSVELEGARKEPGEMHYRIRIGESLAFHLKASQPCHVGIWYLNDKKEVSQLFPNDREKDSTLEPGQPRRVPGTDYQIRAAPPPGMRQLIVRATAGPWTLPAGQMRGIHPVFETPAEQVQFRNFELEIRPRVLKEVVIPIKLEAN